MTTKHKVTVFSEVLKALVPYTEQNLQLSFKPSQFFAKLEYITGSKRSSLASTMSRARRNGFIVDKNGHPMLTPKGLAQITTLTRNEMAGWILVSFDIPESRRTDRARLRSYMKQEAFIQLQQSLWSTKKDYLDELKEVIAELKLGQHVAIFIAAEVYDPQLKLMV